MRRAKSLGRPRLGRSRLAYGPSIEAQVIDRLVKQSAEAGIPKTTYLERVVSLAHGFESPFLRPTMQPLPTAVDAQELQAYVAELRSSPERCTPVRSDVPTRVALLRLDEELGERINAWCDEHDVDYAAYVRSILRLAAGYESADELRPRVVQDELIPVNRDGRRAVAS